MVVSVLNTCNLNKGNGVLNQSNLESPIHWRQSPETTSPEADQANCILNFNNRGESFNNNDQNFTSHDHKASSPVQKVEENSYYDSENGADNLSSPPAQENSRSSGSEDIATGLFPLSGGCSTSSQYIDDSDDSQPISPPISPSYDDDSFRSGKGASSSSGKPKVHKCKNCDFSTTDKYESWKHLETHLKPEKILRCPNCPFVTEYKHHLDFHIWNHQGMKPYKCDKCAYNCVNKSMLKSHLKSHSDVYQFSCKDCQYRTKYCHSLKIHLRKYRHSPGLVLDSEGNPNPNPVIDVYGNRRGPRQKAKKNVSAATLPMKSPVTGVSAVAAAVTAPTPLPLQPSIPSLAALQMQNLPWMNNVFSSSLARSILPRPAAMSAPPTSFMSEARIPSQESDNLNNNVEMTVNNSLKNLNNNNNANVNNLNCGGKNSPCSSFMHDSNISLDCVKRQPSEDEEEGDMYKAELNLREQSPPKNFWMSEFDRSPLKRERFDHPPRLIPIIPKMEKIDPPPSPLLPTMEKFDHPPSLVRNVSRILDEAPLNLTVSHAPSNIVSVKHQLVSVKNRRKGVACKLKRNANEINSSSRNDVVMEQAEPQNLVKIDENESVNKEWLEKLKNEKHYSCVYCEITFFNQIMFTMHMGHHGYLDPFKCNRCGTKTDNKIDFYAHMISTAH